MDHTIPNSEKQLACIIEYLGYTSPTGEQAYVSK